jgi:hypothetical protein
MLVVEPGVCELPHDGRGAEPRLDFLIDSVMGTNDTVLHYAVQ